MSTLYSISYTSPIGNLKLFASENGLKRIDFADSSSVPSEKTNPILQETVLQLDEYFLGKRTEFDLCLDPEGTLFQKTVWDLLKSTPYGTTRSYQDLAKGIGKPKAARAVGQANNRNPLPIVIPCHRVIGANHSLVGYAGGLAIKKWLLEHENKKNIVEG